MISEEIVAAWPEPIAGRKEQMGAESIEPAIALRYSFFGMLICLIFIFSCLGIFIFCEIPIISPEPPNKPASKGNRGSFTGAFRVAKPKSPVDMNTMNAVQTFCSLVTVYKDMKIRMNGIIVFMLLNIFGTTFMNIGVIAMINGIAVTVPIKTISIASFPFPSLSISCPGKTDRNDSSSVAPVNIDGMKSRIVWVIANATTNETNAIEEILEKNPMFAKRIAATVFMWIPGVIPVKVPIDIPMSIARAKSSMNI